jgi:phosphoribosylanthranilate isomerase
LNIIHSHAIQIIQLHGDESPSYCNELLEAADLSTLELWKVFSVGDTFDFKQLAAYEGVVDKFLFDTSGAEKGGNGITFNWNLLNEYSSSKPFILSGGIGLEQMDAVKKIAASELPLYAIDANSKLEDTPGLKNIDRLQQLMKQLQD